MYGSTESKTPARAYKDRSVKYIIMYGYLLNYPYLTQGLSYGATSKYRIDYISEFVSQTYSHNSKSPFV